MPRKGRLDLTGRKKRDQLKKKRRALAAKAKRAWQPVVLIERLNIHKLGVKNVSGFNTEQLDISVSDEHNPFTTTTNFMTETSISELNECNSFSKITNFKTETSMSEPDECNLFTNTSNFKTETSISELNECNPFSKITNFKTEKSISEPDERNSFTDTTNFMTETLIFKLNECNSLTKITNFKTETSISESDEHIPFTNTINFNTEMQDPPKAVEDKPLSFFLNYKSGLTIPNGESAVTLNKKEFKEKELKLLAVQREMMVKKLRKLVNEAAAAANNVTEPVPDAELLAAPKPDKSNTIFLRNISELTQSNPQSAPTWH